MNNPDAIWPFPVGWIVSRRLLIGTECVVVFLGDHQKVGPSPVGRRIGWTQLKRSMNSTQRANQPRPGRFSPIPVGKSHIGGRQLKMQSIVVGKVPSSVFKYTLTLLKPSQRSVRGPKPEYDADSLGVRLTEGIKDTQSLRALAVLNEFVDLT